MRAKVGAGNLCRPTIFFATVLFRVQPLRKVFCSFCARFSDRFTVVVGWLRVNWEVYRFNCSSGAMGHLPCCQVAQFPQ
jgi:hypothetical protein